MDHLHALARGMENQARTSEADLALTLDLL